MTNKQIEMVMRDMLFVTWEVQPETARKLVNERLELDTRADARGREVAIVSAVCFHVTDVRSAVLPVPRLSFEQVNYRVYVRARGIPSVCFIGMKVNSRMVTAMTSFLSVPIHYDDIEITTSAGSSGTLAYVVKSGGLSASAVLNQTTDETVSEESIAPEFITERLVGYMASGNGVFRINVEQSGLHAVPARPQIVEAPILEQLGLLTRDQSARPSSVLYVREAPFGADAPVREW